MQLELNCSTSIPGYEELLSIQNIKTTLNDFERNHPHNIWRHTTALMSVVWTLADVLNFLEGILKRFVVYTPAVVTPCIKIRVFRPSQSRYAAIAAVEQELRFQLKKPTQILHPIVSAMATQFPDPRLIQYDCGKLQVLDRWVIKRTFNV